MLPHPPKWLRKPVGATWGFGGRLVQFDFASGSNITIKTIIPDKSFSNCVDELEACILADSSESSSEYCSNMAHAATSKKDKEVWMFLKTTFSESSRDEMLLFLGFDKNISSSEQVTELLREMDIQRSPTSETVKDAESEISREPAVPFSFFPAGSGQDIEVDKLVTQSILLGDYETAVELCLGSNRLADALVIAMNGSPELLARAQSVFFQRNIKEKSYCRILKSIVSHDLTDVVENCIIDSKVGWKELLALICTYADQEQLSPLFATLGSRLEGRFGSGPPSILDNKETRAHAASLCYIGSGDLARVVAIWSSQIPRIKMLLEKSKGKEMAGIFALHSFIEKISLLRSSISFIDQDLTYILQEGETFALTTLYEVYKTYASLAARQGKIKASWRALEQIPICYFSSDSEFCALRDRVYNALGIMKTQAGEQITFPYDLINVFDALVVQNNQHSQFAHQPHMGQNGHVTGKHSFSQNTFIPPAHNVNQFNLNSQQTSPYGNQGGFATNQNAGYGTNFAVPSNVYTQQQYNAPPIQQFKPSISQFSAPSSASFSQQRAPALANSGSTGYGQPAPANHYQPPSFTQVAPTNVFQPPVYAPPATHIGQQLPPPTSRTPVDAGAPSQSNRHCNC